MSLGGTVHIVNKRNTGTHTLTNLTERTGKGIKSSNT